MILSRAIASLPRRLPVHRHLAVATLSAAVQNPKPTPKRTYKRTLSSPKLPLYRDQQQALDVAKETKSIATAGSGTGKLPSRPSEVPYEATTANSVLLVGRIAVPVELQDLPNGGYAVSVLVQENPSVFPQFWIPVIFQGEMAQTAAFYLKEKDVISVAGSIVGDVPPSGDKVAQETIKVLVHSLNFVQQKVDLVKDDHATNGNDDLTFKSSGDEKKPDSVGKNLLIGSVKKTGNIGKNIWMDLLDNTQDWWDNRVEKENKKNPKLPDFRHKVNKKALWLDSAPDWVLAKLADPVSNSKSIGRPHKENLWRSLVDNPSEWWDNRFNKINPKAPDFKNKATGEALWLDSSTPAWVLPKLPAPMTKQKAGAKEKKSHFTVPA